MENSRIEAIKELYKTHLEFLGFSVVQDPDDNQVISAKRGDSTYSMRIFDDGIRVRAFRTTSKYARNNRLELLEFANDANNNRLARYFSLNDDTFCIQMTLFCPYERITFGAFLDLFIKELSMVAKLPNADKMLS